MPLSLNNKHTRLPTPSKTSISPRPDFSVTISHWPNNRQAARYPRPSVPNTVKPQPSTQETMCHHRVTVCPRDHTLSTVLHRSCYGPSITRCDGPLPRHFTYVSEKIYCKTCALLAQSGSGTGSGNSGGGGGGNSGSGSGSGSGSKSSKSRRSSTSGIHKSLKRKSEGTKQEGKA